jgi:hypothetical protein
MAEENIIKFKIQSDDASIEGTRKKIEELKSVMLQTSDVDTFNKLALEAGALETEIKRVEDAVTSLAGLDSELTKMSNSFSQVGDSLLSMDFGAAAEEAGSLAAKAKSMNFGMAITSLKSLGSTFMSLGKALLTNPFFLLVSVIVAIGVALYKLMDELGIITAIFKLVGDAIGFVIQSLKDLLDWLGLTSYAEDEEAEKQKQRTEDLQAMRTAAFNQMITEKELEIAKMQAEGASIEDIEDAEINLATTRLEASKAELKRTEASQMAVIAQLTAWGQLKAATELQLKLDEQRNQVKQDEIALIGTTSRVEKARSDRGKASADNAKKRAEDEKKIQEEIANAQLKADEMIAKAKIDFIEDDIERARQMAIFNEEQSFKSIDLTKLTLEQQEMLTKQHEARLLAIEEEAGQQKLDLKNKQIQAQKDLEQQLLNLQDESLAKTLEFLDISKNSEISKLQEKLNQDLITTEQFEEAKLALEDYYRKESAKATDEDTQKKKDKLKEEADYELAVKESLQSSLMGIASDSVALLGKVAEKNKSLQLAALAIEKGAAIAQVVINAGKEMSANAVTASLNPANAATFGAAGAAQLAKANIMTKVRAGLNIASIVAAGLQGAKSINASTPVDTSGGGGDVSTASMGNRQTTPTMNLNNGVEQNAGGGVNRVTVVDYTDIQDKGNELSKLQSRVSLI